MVKHAAVKAIARLVARWVGMTSGGGSLLFGLFMLYRSATGNPVPPNQALVVIGWVAFVTFVLSAGAGWWLEHDKVRELEQALARKTSLRVRVASQPDIPGDDPRTTHRLFVHNDGPGAATDVRVSIIGIDREPAAPVGAYHDNFPYHFRDSGGGTTGCTINERTEDYFQLAMSWRSGDQRRIVDGLDGIEIPPDRYRRVAMPDGAVWRLRLRVSASNADTQDVLVITRAEDNQQVSMRVGP
jgi:hypothetical protein